MTLSREGKIQYLKDNQLNMKMCEFIFSRNEDSLDTLIKKHGADVDINWVYPLDYYRRTPLHIACNIGHVSMTKTLLLHRDIYVSQKDWLGMTPFDLAVKSKHKDCAKVVWERLVSELRKKENCRPNQFRKITKASSEGDAEFCERVSSIFNLLFITEEDDMTSAVPPTEQYPRWMVLKKSLKSNTGKWEPQEFEFETVSFTGESETEIKKNIDNVRKIIDFHDY